MQMRPLTPLAGDREKDFFKNRLDPAVAAQGEAQGPVCLQAISFGGCDSGWRLFPGNPTQYSRPLTRVVIW